MFILFPIVLRVFYPVAGETTPDIFQRIIYGIGGVFLIHGGIWLLIRLTFKHSVWDWFENQFDDEVFEDSGKPYGQNKTIIRLCVGFGILFFYSALAAYLASSISVGRIVLP